MPDIRTLLVRAPNWLGDAVMALPAIAAVRQAYRAASFVIAAPASIAPMFEFASEVCPDEILVVDRAREQTLIRDARADAVLLLPNSFRSAWTARRAAVPERWGYAASGRSWLLTRAVKRAGRRVHHARYYLELVRGLGIDAAERAPRLEATPAVLDRADALLRDSGIAPGSRLVGFAPGAAYGNAKRWPPDRVADVMGRLARDGCAIVMLGAAADRGTGRAIESSLPPGVTIANLIGRTDLRQLVGVVARCSAFVSNDSGAMHVAAALRVPLTAVFGPTDERVTSPVSDAPAEVILRDVFCRPCMLRECPIDHRCMKRIAADDVLASVQRHLNG
jgi:lipopolysaccharide heptosyltransferase II